MIYVFNTLVFGLIFAALLQARAEYRPIRLRSPEAFGVEIPLVSQACAMSACRIAQHFCLLLLRGVSTMCNVASTLGYRFLLGALVVLLIGSFNEDLTQARADNKKPAPKAPPPSPPKQPPAKPAAPMQHHKHEAKSALALPKPHANAHKHPPVLAALHHLEEAFATLAEHPNPLLGNYRIVAMGNIRAAYLRINAGIAGAVGVNQPETTPLRGLPAGGDFPHVRTALGKVRNAQNELKTVAPNLRGERRAAIVTLNVAVANLEMAMQHARSLEK